MSTSFKSTLFSHHIGYISSFADGFEKSAVATNVPVANIVIDCGDSPTYDQPMFRVTDDQEGDQPGFGSSYLNYNNRDRGLPATLEACLETSQSRRLLYLSFRHIMMECMESLEGMAKGLKETIPAGCEWLMKMWTEYSLTEYEDAIFRAKLFHCLKKLLQAINTANPPPSNRELLKNILKQTILLQSTSDLIHSLFLNPDETFDDSEMLEWAWKAYIYDEEDFMLSFSESLEERMLCAQFSKPHSCDEERLARMMKDPGTCLSVLKLMIQSFQSQGHYFQKARLSMSDKLPSRRMSLWKNTATTPGNCSEVLSASYSKVEWIMSFLSKNSQYFSVASAKIALDTCLKVSLMIDPESENDGWQFACNDFVNKLRFVIGKDSLSAEYEANPPFICNELIPSSNVILLLQAKQSEGTKPRDDDCVPSVMASVTSIKNTRSVVFVDYLNVIAGLEDIRFQVDPSAERIVLKSAVGGQETISDEILTSSSTGTLVVTKKDLIWSVSTLDFANTSGFTYTRSSAFRIRHSAVTRFSAVMLKHTEDKRKQSFFLESAKSSLDHLTQMNQRQSSRVGSMLNKSAEAAGQLFTSILNRQTDNKNLKDVRKAYAVVLHTRNEAFKFYPFFDDEASQMLQALTAVTGLSPFKSHEFVQSVLTKRVELTRRQALRQLLDEPSPWIDNNVDLVRIVDALISDTKPQLIVDMERLFHSCKIESEVTKEVTALLRRSWHYTQSDQSRMKILSVIDRILDRVIMRQEDMVFTTTFKWLKHLEETINPYRNPEMLKLVLYLVKRAKMIQIEPLAPLPNDQQESMFDHFDEYEKLLQFQEEVGTKLHDLKE